jgi:hypothetical protein
MTAPLTDGEFITVPESKVNRVQKSAPSIPEPN